MNELPVERVVEKAAVPAAPAAIVTDSPVRPVVLRPTCLSLRHKLMYADGRQAEPGMVDESWETRVYFCNKSQDSLGPDGRPVHPRACDAGRGCFRKC